MQPIIGTAADDPRRGCAERMNSASEFVTKSFGSFIHGRPITVMAVTGFLSITLMALGIKFSTWPDFSDPAKGFETRNTELSGRVVAWSKLDKLLSIYPDPSKPYYRALLQSSPPPAGGEDNRTIATDSSHCSHLTSRGVRDVDTFSQVIFEAGSLDDLFSLETLGELCRAQGRLNGSLDPIRPALSGYPHFRDLASYVACSAGLTDCRHLTQRAAAETASLVRRCYPHRDAILSCGATSWTNSCGAIPAACRSAHLFDLYYFVLSRNAGQPGPVYTSVVLPARQWDAYQYLATPGVTSERMLAIYDRVLGVCESTRQGVTFRGVNMGLKFEAWLRSFYGDWYYVCLALVLVYLVIWLYSGSLFFTLAVFFVVLVSMGVAYFVYRLVFRIQFFPFMNLFMIILLIGIGADDAFVLKHILDGTTRGRVLEEDMLDGLSQAALSMFICVATTSAAFYANLVSDVVVVRCFGVFAGTTMLVNYLLVVTWLPSAIIFLHTYLDPLCARLLPPACLAAASRLWARGALLPRFLLLTALPRFVMVLKYVWIGLFGSLFLGACLVVFYKPGIAPPANNPLQMFKPSNPLEWFDDRVPEQFEFARRTRFGDPITIALVFGIEPEDDNGPMSPNQLVESTDQHSLLSTQPGFQMNLTLLAELGRVCRGMNRQPFVLHRESEPRCFPDQFFHWSAGQVCGGPDNDTEHCCNVTDQRFNERRDLAQCLARATLTLDTASGGPIFRVGPAIGVDGFLLFYDTNRTSWTTTSYQGMHQWFSQVEVGVRQVLSTGNSTVVRSGWPVPTLCQTLLWYDLQNSLLRGTPFSILVSAGLALVVAAVTMRAFLLSLLSVLTVFAVNMVVVASLILLGWQLNIVESTLIVLTVGLAFDFTLNYAIAYQLCPRGGREVKVCTVLRYMGMPVLLSCLTTLLAGLVMLPSAIMAYYQIGLFMVLVATVSWLYSALFFLSLLAVFGPEECEWTTLKAFLTRLFTSTAPAEPLSPVVALISSSRKSSE